MRKLTHNRTRVALVDEDAGARGHLRHSKTETVFEAARGLLP
jgi:hypothetical protein